jgi:actin-related protein 7
MKRMVDDKGSADDNGNGNGQLVVDDVAFEPVVRGYVRDWDAMEDLLNYVLYSGLGWEIGNEGQILFTDPLCTPKVFDFRSFIYLFNYLMFSKGSFFIILCYCSAC